jgi:hypothetical protein
MQNRLLCSLFITTILMLLLTSCDYSAKYTATESIVGTNTPSPTMTMTDTPTKIPTMTAVPTLLPSATLTVTIVPTPTDPTNHVWADPLFGPCVSCELEKANVKVNSNGFIGIGYEKDMQRSVLILDQSQSSPGRTYLIVEITRHKSIEQSSEYSLQRKLQKIEENFKDFQTKEISQFSQETWMMQQNASIIMLGSTYGQFEFVIYTKTYMFPGEEQVPFTDLNSAARIIIVAAQAQFQHFKDVFPLSNL